MKDLQAFLKHNDLELTLMNEYGESCHMGKAEYVKPYAHKNIVRWVRKGRFDNKSPFTYAVVHGKRRVFEAVHIKPVQLSTETVVEMEF